MKKFLKRALKVFAILALLLAVLYIGWDIWSRRVLAAAQERLLAAHLPMTVADISPPTVPDADNSALVLDKLSPLLKPLASSADGTDLLARMIKFNEAHPAYRLDDAGTQELAALLDAAPVRQVFVLIDEATVKKGYDAKLHLERGPFFLYPLISDWKAITQLLGSRARLEASRSQPDAACRAVSEIITLAEFHANEPTMISQLVRISCWQVAVKELEMLASAGALTPDWNQKFSEQLARLDIVPGFAKALHGERIGLGANLFEAMLTRKTFEEIGGRKDLDPDHTVENLLRVSFLYPKPLLRVEYAYYLDLFRQLETALASSTNDPWGKWFSSWRAAQRLPRFGVVIRVIIPALGGVAVGLRKEQMRLKVAAVGLALENYRAAKGGYPAALADLAPDFIKEVPPDVFTDQPLHYRTEAGGAVVHSVGPNLADDGGIEDKEADKDDIGWFAGAAAARKFATPAVSADGKN
jgi:hypothetical protein